MKNSFLSNLALVAAVTFGLPTVAMAQFDVVLPFPGDGSGAQFCNATDAGGDVRSAICMDGTNPDGDAGIVVAFQYEGFWSYSVKILNEIQDESGGSLLPASDFGSYDDSTGTGNLDLLLYTGAAGADNQGVGPDGDLNFEDPVLNQAGNTTEFAGWWGQDDQDNDGTVDDVNGPVTLGNLLTYLQAFDPENDVPTFLLDLNQTGSEASLFSKFEALVLTPDGDTVVANFPLDTITNGMLDSGDGSVDPFGDAFTLAFGEVTFTGETLGSITVDHNMGSGLMDFAAFNSNIQLSNLISNFGPDYLFVVNLWLAGLNDGFEEIFLTGRVGPSVVTVSEPGSLALLVIALVGLGMLSNMNGRRFGRNCS